MMTLQNSDRLLPTIDALADTFRPDVGKDEADAVRKVKDALTPRTPVLQLYGIQGAGKSTWTTCATRGCQVVPIGSGRATTAVTTEIIDPAIIEADGSMVEWATPEEVLALFLDGLGEFADPDDETRSLTDKADRRVFLKRLREANNQLRNVSGGELDEGMISSTMILRHFESYLRRIEHGRHLILGPNERLFDWVRQPPNWGAWNSRREAMKYSFEDVRCLFLSRAVAVTPLDERMNGAMLKDPPGFGVTSHHDAVCRAAQAESDAVVLILGSNDRRITRDQMNELRALAAGLRGSVYVVWNPRVGNAQHAREQLREELARIKAQTGIDIPEDRCHVANLLLAVRAIELRALLRGELDEGTLQELLALRRAKELPMDGEPEELVRQFLMLEARQASMQFAPLVDPIFDASSESDLTELIERSGWNGVTSIAGAVDAEMCRRRELRAARSILRQTQKYLAKIPNRGEVNEARMTTEALCRLINQIDDGDVAPSRKQVKAIASSHLDADGEVVEDFLGFVGSEQTRTNLKQTVDGLIDNASRYSKVPEKIRKEVEGTIKARVRTWADGAAELKRREVVDATLGPARHVAGRILQQSDLPKDAAMPRPTLEETLSLKGFVDACGRRVSQQASLCFAQRLSQRVMSNLRDTGQSVADGARNLFGRLFGRKPTVRKSFDPGPVKNDAAAIIDNMLSQSELRRIFVDVTSDFLDDAPWREARAALRKTAVATFDAWRDDVLEIARAKVGELEATETFVPLSDAELDAIISHVRVLRTLQSTGDSAAESDPLADVLAAITHHAEGNLTGTAVRDSQTAAAPESPAAVAV